MVKRWSVAAVMAATFAVFAASSAASDVTSILSPSKPITIIAFGSSSTQGVGASRPTATYPAQLEGLLRRMMPADGVLRVLNRGIGGEDCDDLMRRFKTDVLDRHPDIVIYQTGSNDPMRHVPLARFERETRESILAMRAAGIIVILMEPQWCPTLDKYAAANQYRDVIRRIGSEMGIVVVKRSELMRDWVRSGTLTMSQMLASDGLHMRDDGYALLARRVASDIVKTAPFRQTARTELASL